MAKTLPHLLSEIRSCEICKAHLPHGPRPILTASSSSRILIAGQAPGRIVHTTGIPWDDRSGDRLREWLGVSKEVFYNEKLVALVPIGFCYPGSGKSGDLPPRSECRATWHDSLIPLLKNVKLTVLVGQHAMDYHLADQKRGNLTETVKAWKSYSPEIFPIPHPSPRNQRWTKENPWFEREMLPELQKQVMKILMDSKSQVS